MPSRFWGFIIISLLLITACTPAPNLRNDAYFHDTSLIDGEPCFAPCWRNLIPGETTWDEATEIISTFEDVTNLDRVRNRDTGEEIYNFNYADGPQCCRIYTRDGNALAAILLLVAPEMPLGEVVNQYGEPQYIQADDVTDDQTFVILAYPDVPMLVYVFSSGITSGEIVTDSEVIGVVYLADAEMTAFLNEELFVWDGYGTLSDILTGNTVIPASETTPESD